MAEAPELLVKDRKSGAYVDIMQMIDELRESGDKLFQKIGERIVSLETELKHVKNFTYRGVYKDDTSYHKNNFCTHAGSLWICECDTIDSRPGTPQSGWKLVAKGGHR